VAEVLKQGRPPGPSEDAEVGARVGAMLAAVETEGEAAVRRFSRELDSWDPPSFAVPDAELRTAGERIDPELREAIDLAHAQVRAFAQAQLGTLAPLDVELGDGVHVGHRLVPVRAVGAYVPGGRYPLISSALMSIAVARVAGVERIVAMSAPRREGGIAPATLYAMRLAGADAVFALGGVQAMAAMAFGALEGLEPVDMIVGAGNAYVAEAKRRLFGRVGIDLLAGPTEVLVIADADARPHVVAVDLLAQAEHGPTSPATLVTTSRALGEAVLAGIDGVLAAWPTADAAGAAWRELGTVLVAGSDDEAVTLADAYAPEHLQLQVAEPAWFQERLRNYGSLFVGERTTVAFGDKAVGTNHTLPTNGGARYTGGLWVGSYLKWLTFQRLEPEASARIARASAVISRAEHMHGHAASADVRLELERHPGLSGG
jgi:sulfopropanediol 3-dehydrogenase